MNKSSIHAPEAAGMQPKRARMREMASEKALVVCLDRSILNDCGGSFIASKVLELAKRPTSGGRAIEKRSFATSKFQVPAGQFFGLQGLAGDGLLAVLQPFFCLQGLLSFKRSLQEKSLIPFKRWITHVSY